MRNVPKAKNAQRIYTPGEIEWEHYKKSLDNGIELPTEVKDSLVNLSTQSGVALKLA